MKLKSPLTYLISLNLLFSISTQASPSMERWFEIEVILFQQLENKNALNEDFSVQKPLRRYKKVTDLLTPYLQPDLSYIKGQLPVCNQVEKAKPSIELFDIKAEYPIKTPEQLAQEYHNELTEQSLNNVNNNVEQFSEQPAIYQQAPNKQEVAPFEQTLNTNNANNNLAALGARNPAAESESEIAINANDISPEQKAETAKLLAQAEAYFYNKDIQPVIFPTKLCRLSENTIAKLKKDDPNYNPDYFPVDHVPNKINGSENLYSKKPYLISSKNFKLDNLYRQLRYSKNFRPILHLGWREAPKVSLRKSTPMRIFAGKNLQQTYQEALEKYQEQTLIAQQASPLTIENTPDISQNELNKIMLDIEQLPANADTLLATLTPYQTQLAQEQGNEQHAPVAPPQQWQIEGNFNVHLNHYLYITADFKIADMLPANIKKQLSNQQVEQLSSIHFSQNRRVISKEIHYFDHPYLGMIVQIRRHSRPKSASEDTRQAIN